MTEEQLRGAGLTLRLDPEAKALIATVQPAANAAPIDEAWLRARIIEQGFGALRYLPAAATLLLGQYNSGSPVAALRLCECVDASCQVTLTPDALSAVLNITPAQGGAPLSVDAVRAQLAELGVNSGIDEAAIARAVADDAACDLVIARGQPPVHGEDGRLEKLLPDARDRRPREDESGRIDYRDLGEIAVVHPGDRLMQRRPATAGSAGLTLLGQPLMARPGKDVLYAANLAGVACEPGNPDILIATLVGQPVVVPGGMIVEPVYSVGEVGTASGNINFDGSVVIKGDVASGMSVRVSGDIEVGGMVEAATLEAGGSIVIKGGVVGGIGRKEGSEHFIRCGASFHAAYAQQARIEAGDSIFIDDTAMQCELAAANHILVGDKRRGHIIGGKAQATLSIKGKVLGSPNRVVTRFDIGVDPNLHKLQQEKAKQRDGKETQLLEISKLLEFARQNPQRIRPEMLDKARATAAVLADEIAACRAEEELLQKKIELAQQSRVIAEQAMYEGVEVYVGNQRYRVVGEHGAASIGLGKSGVGMLGPEDA